MIDDITEDDVLEKSMPYYGTSFSRNDTLEVLKQYSKVIIFNTVILKALIEFSKNVQK